MSFLNRIGANREVLALSLGRLGDGVGNSILFVVMPLYIDKLPAPWLPWPSTVRTGIFISLFGLIMGLAQPLAGAVIDRVNRRKLFVQIGLAILGLSTLAFVFAGQFLTLLGLRFLQGLGASITVPATLALLTLATEKATRGGSMGTFTTFRVAGLGIGPVLGGLIYDQLGFNAAFYAGAGFIALGLVAVQLFVKERRVEPQGPPRPFKIIDTELVSWPFVALGSATFTMAIAFAMIVPLEKQFNDQIGETAFAFGVAFSALMVTRLLTQVPLGRLSDRVGRKPIIVIGLLLMAASTWPMGLVQTTWELVALRVLQGVASGAIAAPVFALAGDLSRKGGEGRQMSLVTMGFALGLATGTLAGGIAGTWSLFWPFVGAAVACVVGAALVQLVVTDTVQGAEPEGVEDAPPPAHRQAG